MTDPAEYEHIDFAIEWALEPDYRADLAVTCTCLACGRVLGGVPHVIRQARGRDVNDHAVWFCHCQHPQCMARFSRYYTGIQGPCPFANENV